MKRFLVILTILAAILFLTPGAALPDEALGVELYMQRVARGNDKLRAGVKSVEAAYYSVLASVAYQRPALAISTGGSYLSGREQLNVLESDLVDYNINLGLTHRIDLSGQFSLDERQQVLFYEIQRADFDSLWNETLGAAEEAYWTAILAKENISLQQDVLSQREENLRVASEKYRQEVVPKLDVIRADAMTVEAESLITEAEAEYRNVLAVMANAVGGEDVFPIDEGLLVPLLDTAIDHESASGRHPDVRAAAAALERARVVKKLRAKGMSPTLDAAVNWVPLSDHWSSSTPQKGEVGVTLRLSIPIFDGNATRYKTLNADRLLQAAEAALASAQNKTEMDLRIALSNWEKAAALERDKKRQIERSNEELRMTELMYQEGLGAQIDLISAQTENQRVRTEYLNAVKEMYIARVQIRKATGAYVPDGYSGWKDAVGAYGKGDTAKKTATFSETENHWKGSF